MSDRPEPESTPAEPVGSSFKKAFWRTALPLSALGLLSTATSVSVAGGFSEDGGYLQLLYYLWFLGAGGAVVALFVSLGLAVGRQGAAARGVLAGIAVGVLTLGVTCFINIGQFFIPI